MWHCVALMFAGPGKLRAYSMPFFLGAAAWNVSAG